MPIINNNIRPLIDYNIEEARRRRQLQGQSRNKFPSRINTTARDLSVEDSQDGALFPFNGRPVDFDAIQANEEFDPIEFSFTGENETTRNIDTFYYPQRIQEEARFRTAQNIPNPKLKQIRSYNG